MEFSRAICTQVLLILRRLGIHMGDLKQVESVDPQLRTSALNIGPDESSSSISNVCYWNGIAYSTGAVICASGTQMRCYPDGTWSAVGKC